MPGVAQMAALNLTSDILEEEHSAADYLNWVRSIIKRVKASPDGLRRIRLREGLANELMNEALPIGRLASAYFRGSKDVSIRLKVGNQNYDATVSDRRTESSGVEHIEVTLASEGEDHFLRMKVLHERGEVSALGPVKKRGTRKTGLTVTVEPEAMSQAEVLRRERDRVAEAVTRKLGKRYPASTLLLIAFDDAMAFDRPDNIENIRSTISGYLPQLSGFHSVVLVGTECNLLMPWEIERAI